MQRCPAPYVALPPAHPAWDCHGTRCLALRSAPDPPHHLSRGATGRIRAVRCALICNLRPRCVRLERWCPPRERDGGTADVRLHTSVEATEPEEENRHVWGAHRDQVPTAGKSGGNRAGAKTAATRHPVGETDHHGPA